MWRFTLFQQKHSRIRPATCISPVIWRFRCQLEALVDLSVRGYRRHPVELHQQSGSKPITCPRSPLSDADDRPPLFGRRPRCLNHLAGSSVCERPYRGRNSWMAQVRPVVAPVFAGRLAEIVGTEFVIAQVTVVTNSSEHACSVEVANPKISVDCAGTVHLCARY